MEQNSHTTITTEDVHTYTCEGDCSETLKVEFLECKQWAGNAITDMKSDVDALMKWKDHADASMLELRENQRDLATRQLIGDTKREEFHRVQMEHMNQLGERIEGLSKLFEGHTKDEMEKYEKQTSVLEKHNETIESLTNLVEKSIQRDEEQDEKLETVFEAAKASKELVDKVKWYKSVGVGTVTVIGTILGGMAWIASSDWFQNFVVLMGTLGSK